MYLIGEFIRMRKKTKFYLLSTIIFTLSALPLSVTATTPTPEQTPCENQIVNTETVEIDGIPVTFTLYNNNGVYSETAKIGGNSFNRSSKTDYKVILDKAIQIADQHAESIYSFLGSKESAKDSLSGSKSIHIWTEDKNNAAYGTGTGENRHTYAGHWATIDYTIVDTAGSMKAYNGASRVLYDGSRTLDQMKVTETITKKSLEFGLSVSWPPGFSISPSSNSATLSTTWNGDYGFCTQYRNNFQANALINTGTFVTVETISQVTSKNESYTASVNSQW